MDLNWIKYFKVGTQEGARWYNGLVRACKYFCEKVIEKVMSREELKNEGSNSN